MKKKKFRMTLTEQMRRKVPNVRSKNFLKKPISCQQRPKRKAAGFKRHSIKREL